MKSKIPIILLLLACSPLTAQYYAGLAAWSQELFQLPAAPEVYAPVWTLEDRPAFPGGQLALADFLQQNVQYPDMASRYGLEGRVIVRFTVHSDGRVGDIEVLRGPGLGLNEAVVEALQHMPDWRPALIAGKPVCSRHILPVQMRLTP